MAFAGHGGSRYPAQTRCARLEALLCADRTSQRRGANSHLLSFECFATLYAEGCWIASRGGNVSHRPIIDVDFLLLSHEARFQRARCRRDRGARSDQHRQDPSRHRTHARPFVRHHRAAAAAARVTGEEKIKPPNPRYWVSTVEAMPRDLDVAFLAIDEVQLGADLERGHVFTDRILNRRGREETLVLGAQTVRPMIERLLPGAHILTRPRLSQLSFAGEKKITRLPRRSAIVAFSAEEVYSIAELIRRQRGGAAVVLGALSPRPRHAQVALYQSGDVEYLVATDAIGMGLNLDVDHVAFASDRKFDGYQFRRLNPAELAQIAGRAGRATRDGTFGTTGRCPPFDTELVQALESHSFEPVKVLQWRNTDLDFSSVGALQASPAAKTCENGRTSAPRVDEIIELQN